MRVCVREREEKESRPHHPYKNPLGDELVKGSGGWSLHIQANNKQQVYKI